MSTLLLRLAGPMQAWGDASRHNHRGTRREPTKSGVLGMMAAAEGRRRTDPLEDLAALRFGVRTDQIGTVERDLHTAKRASEKHSALTHRDYLMDAVFLAALEGPDDMLEGLAEAISRPAFPMYLGRRSCPPAGRVLLGIAGHPLEDALEETRWQAADWYRRRQPEEVALPTARDAAPGEHADEMVADVPVSFRPGDRRHGLRGVVHGWVTKANDLGRTAPAAHDPMILLGGA